MALNTKRLHKPSLQYNIHCKYCTKTLTRQDAQTGKIVKIQDEMCHISCLKCSNCQKVIGVTPCFQQHGYSGAFRCADCHRTMTSPKCHGCRLPTFEKRISAFGVYWHEACFKCRGCRKQFKRHEYVMHEGSAYDEDCYYRVIRNVEETNSRLKKVED